MIDLNKFELIVKSMTAKEIIMAMVEGLRHPSCVVGMGTFGSVKEGICYGCIATITIARIYGIGKLDEETTLQIKDSQSFMWQFKWAINDLRMGCVDYYNAIAEIYDFPTIREEDLELPILEKDYTEEDLQAYVKLAKMQ